ncbi:MAG: NAD(P)-dependent oxidoreductase [Clostridia bacterium]|nr:NAD(P)-dependent oxidoreductase [Clostridia bacterium]
MTRNTIWVTGAEGRLGSALVQLLSQDIDNKVIGTDKAEVDITDLAAVDAAMDVYHPTVVINCASMSDMDECEKNMVEAFKINTLGARNLAMATQRVNAKIIQMSTDDVFEGKTGIRLTEFDIPTPKNVYGKSKLAGEMFVRELNPKHLIIRSSWVYGTGKADFMTKVLDHAKKGESFEVPMDVISTPTSALTLAKFVELMIDHSEYGIYHASCEGSCSRRSFAQAILKAYGYDERLAEGVFAADKAMSTLLENLMMKMTGIYEMPHWTDDFDA